MAKARWYHKAVGEISKLRSAGIGGYIAGKVNSGYKLDSSKVDYDLANQLYYNTHDEYKLGAGFAKTVINSKVSFMGTPSFKTADKNAEVILSNFRKDNISKMQKTTRDALRGGDAYVWVTRETERDKSLYPEQHERIVYNVIPAKRVTNIKIDPTTGEVLEYELTSFHEWLDSEGNELKGTVIQRVRRGEIITEADGDVPEGIELGSQPTPWDFIPIVHFKNEGDDGIYGQSELESIEPFMKAYHDTMIQAMKSNKMHSTPRLKLNVKDVKSFLLHNLGITDPVKFFKDGGTINLDGSELLILADGDNAEFIEVKSAIGDSKDLLKFLFYCIVDASETPEFVFGVHTPSSLSSVKEQMPILVRSIQMKREHFTDSWKRLARIVLAMTSKSNNMRFSTFATELAWDNIDHRTKEEISKELVNTVTAITTGVSAELIGKESACDYLAKLIDTMKPYDPEDGVGEKERIDQMVAEKMRMPDRENIDREYQSILKQLKELGLDVNNDDKR
jgi:hypothetical protein